MIGALIADRYEVLERVGQGGMAVVYKAMQQPIGRLVALKVLLKRLSESDRSYRRFVDEARIISRLRHPNTVTLHDFGHMQGGQLYIVMEYLEGGRLRDLIDQGRVSEQQAISVCRQIALALAEAHVQGVVHRDLKPENVLFDQVHGEDFVVRVLDFGLAKLVERGVGDTIPGMRVGTVEYMSPEQAFGRPLDGKSDVYSLGVLLFELLTGRVPFDGASSHEVALAHQHDPVPPLGTLQPPIAVDPELASLLAQMLAKRPADRPPIEDVLWVLKGLESRHSQSAEGALSTLATIVDQPIPEYDDDDDLDESAERAVPAGVLAPQHTPITAPRPPAPDLMESARARISEEADRFQLRLAARRTMLLAASAGAAVAVTVALLLL